MRCARVRVGIAVNIGVAVCLGGVICVLPACYRPRIIDCVVACGAAPAQACASGMSCSNGLCTRGLVCPRPPSPPPATTCVLNTLRCWGHDIQRCDQDGVWQTDHTCALPQECFAATCGVCTPGTARCDDAGGAVQRCTSAGALSPAVACQGAAQCSGGLCTATAGFSALSAGEGHTCATVGAGVKCWGDNTYGQLGVGDANPRGVAPAQMGDNLPFVALGPGDQVMAVAAGGTHSCAMLFTGQVKCWGDNVYGQLGVGDRRARGLFRDDLGAALPAVSLGKNSALAISAGRAHTCALLPSLDGEVICWGDNRSGQLGVGDRVPRGTGETAANDPVPVDLGSAGGVVAVSAGANHSCALLSNGAVKCWGANEDGQLGQGDVRPRATEPGEMGDQLNPVDLGPGRIATAVAAGGSHTCALLDDGSVKCWGANSAGQLGIGATDNRGSKAGQMGSHLPAVALGPGQSALAIAAGAAHSCALLSDGRVKCWGANLFGQLGQGDTQNRGAVAAALADQSPLELGTSGTEALRADLITTSSNHTCALLMNGAAKCWGSNAAGQLGQGDRNNRGDAAGELGDGLPAIRLVGPAAP